MSTAKAITMDDAASTAPSRGRTIASRIMLVVFCVTIVLSVPAVWARNQIVDTDRYVRTVSPLASETAIQTALADRITTTLSDRLESLASERLSGDQRFLTAPLGSMLDQYVNETVQAIVTSDQFPEIWDKINRAAHPTVSAVLTGNGTQSLATENGQIVLNIEPLLTEVLNRLRDRGLDIVDRIPVDDLDTTFVLYESQDLVSVQFAVDILQKLAVWLPLAALISLVASLGLSLQRRRTLIWSSLGMAVGMTLLVILLATARWWTIGHLPAGVNQDAATVFFETIGRYLRDGARALALIGIGVAAVAYVTRPGGWLGRKGRAATSAVKGTRGSGAARRGDLDRAGTWVAAHRVGVAIGIGVITCLLLIAWDPLSASRALAILIGMAVGYGILALVDARAPEPVATAVATQPIVAESAGAPSPVQATGSPSDDARSQLVALTNDLSTDDLHILRRLALMLRASR